LKTFDTQTEATLTGEISAVDQIQVKFQIVQIISEYSFNDHPHAGLLAFTEIGNCQISVYHHPLALDSDKFAPQKKSTTCMLDIVKRQSQKLIQKYRLLHEF